MTLRRRILLAVLPLVVLLVSVGIGGVGLLDNLGRRSNEIIRENFVSLRAMHQLEQALAEIDQLSLTSTHDAEPMSVEKLRGFDTAFVLARAAVDSELANITEQGEQEAAEALRKDVEGLVAATEKLVQAAPTERWKQYAEVQQRLKSARLYLEQIWQINEAAMARADVEAQVTARRSTIWLTCAVVLALALSAASVWWLMHIILRPIQELTNATEAIGRGQLHQYVPAGSRDELGRLGEMLNETTAKLRAYRQADQNELTRTRRAAQATVDAFPDPVVLLGPDGAVTFANPAAQRILGTTPGAWLPPASLIDLLQEAGSTGRAVIREDFNDAVTFQTPTGESVFLPQVHPVASPDGEALGRALVLHDITRFRLLDRLKSDWVATVSHELKTPLASVRLAVHVLLEEVVGPLEPKQTELLLEARDNTERLYKLMEQLLALAKLEDGREHLNLQTVAVPELLQHAAEEVAPGVADNRLSLKVGVASGIVRVDPLRFGRVLNNLLDNAVAYTNPGGEIDLRATVHGDRVDIVVADTGIGIPPEYHSQVFDRFFRVPGRDATPGTGLGLAIVREIVTAHGGTIRCETGPNGIGTAFILTLPLAGGAA